jgi:hypothetical protein
VNLDRGYDSDATRKRLEERALIGVISEKGKPAPLAATKRWVVERTNSWSNANKKLVWCTERKGGHRLLGGLLESDHRGQARSKSLDSLPLGGPIFSSTMTYWRGLQAPCIAEVSDR